MLKQTLGDSTMKKLFIAGVFLTLTGVIIPPLLHVFGEPYFRGVLSGIMMSYGWVLIFLSRKEEKA
jgi:hypothetical protein